MKFDMIHWGPIASATSAAPEIPVKFIILLVAILLGALALRLLWDWMRRGHETPRAGLWRRLRMRRHPGAGFAGRWELWRRYGLGRARKIARHARPSLGTLDLYGYGKWRNYATFLGWAQGWLHRWRVYATHSDIVLVIAAPQKGKSVAAAGRIIDAPGPVVVTSIRGDLIANTAGLRQRVGNLHVFNPEGVGEWGTTFRWNPVAGCQDPATAIRRAGHMVEAVETRGLSDSNFWESQAVMVLSSYMHAAGLVGGNLRHVWKWITEDDPTPVEICTRAVGAAQFAANEIRDYLALHDRTRDSVERTIRQVLRFMLSPEIVETLTPGRGDEFVIADFLRSRDTLYLVASAEAASPVPPLLCALLAEIKHEALIVGSNSAAKRLDPPLTMELDEVANVTPIPVAAWASYAAGSGIRMALYSQSWAQLAGRWGDRGAETIWQTATAKVIMGGSSEPELLQRVAALCGKVYVTVRQHRERDGTKTPVQDWVDVLSPNDVRRLPPGRAVVIVGEAMPTIVRPEVVYKRKDFKAWARSGEAIRLPHTSARPLVAPNPGLLITGGPRADELAARRRSEVRPDPVTQPLPVQRPHQATGTGPFPAATPTPPATPADTPARPRRPWDRSPKDETSS
ncbi:type IV secretory system conjugative DNA transfer family protein [Nonomuraea helvata]|uniref:Type IV secretory system conjugative DNA transfer family protein n=3 Tax=Nonomuraea helvata TaxID=37484 RepID=A0ABV5S5X8_9ACTN